MLVMAPEGTCGDGRCMLRFRTGAFVPGVPVLPICFRYNKRRVNPAWTIINEGWHFVSSPCELTQHPHMIRCQQSRQIVAFCCSLRLRGILVEYWKPAAPEDCNCICLRCATRKQYLPCMRCLMDQGGGPTLLRLDLRQMPRSCA